MNVGKGGPVQGLGYGLTLGYFEFSPNGSSDPASASYGGGLARYITSITYSATGVQTIVFTSDFGFATAPVFKVEPQLESLTEHFQAQVTGSFNTTTRTLVITQHRNGTGRVVAAHADAKIRVWVLAHDTQGK